MRVGDFEVSTIDGGTFRLDGGAMFGSVPRNLWERKLAPDEENCVPLATRLLWIEPIGGPLLDGEREVTGILVDVGNGSKADEKVRRMFAIDHHEPESWGVPLARLSDVVLTHLHFDHAGGITKLGDDGKPELTFPQARVHLQRQNWENAQKPWERERASYLSENIEPLREGDLRIVDGDGEVLAGIEATVVHGHTTGLQWLRIGSGEGAVAFPSDLVPTSHHLHLPWIMGYDQCAAMTYKEKEAFLSLAVDERWVVVFEHDPEVAAGTVKQDSRGRFVLDERVEL